MRVFVSHAVADIHTPGFQRLVTALGTIANLTYLQSSDPSRGPKPGTDWFQWMKNGMIGSDAVIVLDSVNLRNGEFGSLEVGMAVAHEKPIVRVVSPQDQRMLASISTVHRADDANSVLAAIKRLTKQPTPHPVFVVDTPTDRRASSELTKFLESHLEIIAKVERLSDAPSDENDEPVEWVRNKVEAAAAVVALVSVDFFRDALAVPTIGMAQALGRGIVTCSAVAGHSPQLPRSIPTWNVNDSPGELEAVLLRAYPAANQRATGNVFRAPASEAGASAANPYNDPMEPYGRLDDLQSVLRAADKPVVTLISGPTGSGVSTFIGQGIWRRVRREDELQHYAGRITSDQQMSIIERWAAGNLDAEKLADLSAKGADCSFVLTKDRLYVEVDCADLTAVQERVDEMAEGGRFIVRTYWLEELSEISARKFADEPARLTLANVEQDGIKNLVRWMSNAHSPYSRTRRFLQSCWESQDQQVSLINPRPEDPNHPANSMASDLRDLLDGRDAETVRTALEMLQSQSTTLGRPSLVDASLFSGREKTGADLLIERGLAVRTLDDAFEHQSPTNRRRGQLAYAVIHQDLFRRMDSDAKISRERRAELLARFAFQRRAGELDSVEDDADRERLLLSESELQLAEKTGFQTINQDCARLLVASQAKLTRDGRVQRARRVLVVVLVAAVIAAIALFGRAQGAEQKRKEERNDRLVAQSTQLIETSRDQAALLSVEHAAENPGSKTSAAMLKVLAAPLGPEKYYSNRGQTLSLGSNRALSVGTESLDFLNLGDGTVTGAVATGEVLTGQLRLSDVSNDGRRVVFHERSVGRRVGWFTIDAETSTGQLGRRYEHSADIVASTSLGDQAIFADADGKLFVLGDDEPVELVVRSGKRTFPALDNIGVASTIAVSEDETWVAVGSVKGVALLERADTGWKGRSCSLCAAPLERVAFRPGAERELVASGASERILHWQDLSLSTEPSETPAPAVPIAIDFSPSGSLLYMASGNELIELAAPSWITTQSRRGAHQSDIRSLEVVDERRVITAASSVESAQNSETVLWDLRNTRHFGTKRAVQDVLAISSTGDAQIATDGEISVRGEDFAIHPGLIGSETVRRIWEINGSVVLEIGSAQLDGGAGRNERQWSRLEVWTRTGSADLASRSSIAVSATAEVIVWYDNEARTLSWSRLDGNGVISTSIAQKLNDGASARPAESFLEIAVDSSSEEVALVGRSLIGIVPLAQVSESSLVSSNAFEVQIPSLPTTAAFLDASRLIVGTDKPGLVYLVDLDRRESDVLIGHEDAVWWTAYDEETERLYTGGQDSLIRVWFLSEPNRPAVTLRGTEISGENDADSIIRGMRLSQDGTELASVHGSTLLFWPLDSKVWANLLRNLTDRALTNAERQQFDLE